MSLIFEINALKANTRMSEDLVVALCGAILNLQKLRFFQYFRLWGKSRKVKNFSRFGCGAMWRYPEPSKVRNFSIFRKSQKFLKIWLWRYVALSRTVKS